MKWVIRLVIAAIVLSQTMTVGADEKSLFDALEKMQLCAENSSSTRKECSELYAKAMAEEKLVKNDTKITANCYVQLDEYLKNYWMMMFCWDVVEKAEKKSTGNKPESKRPSAVVEGAKDLRAKREEQVKKLREKLNTVLDVCRKQRISGKPD